MSEDNTADPFRETIHIASGPNIDVHDIQASSAQNANVAAEREKRQAEDEALVRAAASVRRLDGKPDVRGDDGLVHGDEAVLTDEQRAALFPLRGIEAGEGDEEGVSLDAPTPEG